MNLHRSILLTLLACFVIASATFAESQDAAKPDAAPVIEASFETAQAAGSTQAQAVGFGLPVSPVDQLTALEGGSCEFCMAPEDCDSFCGGGPSACVKDAICGTQWRVCFCF